MNDTPRGRLTVGEASRLTGIPVSTLDHWRINGLGPPSTRIDGRVSYDAGDLAAWLAEYQSRPRGRRGPRR